MDRIVGLEPLVEDELARMANALDEAGLPYAMIGANALVLQGVRLERITRDLDLAVAVDDGLDRVRVLLTAQGLRSTSIEHRFVTPLGVEVDVLPLKGSDPEDSTVRFSSGEILSGVGLADAVHHAEIAPLARGLVRVTSLALLIAIKLHTATKRLGEHDLWDAFAALDQYEAGGIRRFDEVDYAPGSGLRFETAGAWLAARDLQSRASRTTLEVAVADAKALLQDDRTRPHPPIGAVMRPLLQVWAEALAPKEDVSRSLPQAPAPGSPPLQTSVDTA